MAESNVKLKHLQPSQYEGWLRRAEAAIQGNEDFQSWDRMGREYRAACTAALEIRDLLKQRDELLEALKAVANYFWEEGEPILSEREVKTLILASLAKAEGRS